MPTVSVVIPALNEFSNIEPVVRSVPVQLLRAAGWETEIVVVDNGSTDGTGAEARRVGARVVHQPDRGYGNAYQAGFAAATGQVVVTGDCDQTYPLSQTLELVRHLVDENLDFLTTNRLLDENRRAMKTSHRFGNWVLSTLSSVLFGSRLVDSQSGMWVFRAGIWPELDVRSTGMGFSQEIKHEAIRKGYRVGEVPIAYHRRQGDVKLHAVRDGVGNILQLLAHRVRPNVRPLVQPGLAVGADAPVIDLARRRAPST